MSKFAKIAKLLLLRGLALALMLLQNILIVRFLPLDEIGRYYLIATVAYLGNAVVFVGADLHLQRQLATLSVDQEFGRAALVRYVALTGAIGALLVCATATSYFVATAAGGWTPMVAVCTLLSVATYVSTLGRNLCQLAEHPVLANLGPIAEGATRALAIVALAVTGTAGADTVAAASACGSLVAAALIFGLLSRVTRNRAEATSYVAGRRQLLEKVLAVGSSGVLNWAQLQGYRPILMARPESAHVVGGVSFLSTLGSTAANAVFTILGQFQIPQQYRTQGASTRRYLAILAVVAVGLALASLPAGAVFLWLAGRTEMMALLYLVAVGVLVEAGNAAIGVCSYHLNAKGKRMWGLPVAGLVGCLTAFALLLVPLPFDDDHLRVALSLVVGQVLAVVTVLYLTRRSGRS